MSMHEGGEIAIMRFIRTGSFLAFLFAASTMAAAQNAAPSWTETKCSRYATAWSEALERHGAEGMGQEFLDAHETFLTSGCAKKADVCPTTPEELAMANVMVIAAMNAGTASTFPPFACN